MTRISRDFVFDSAHFLPNHAGKCKNTHGHQWRVRVTIEGKVNGETGMLIDFQDLKRVVNKYVIDVLDHKLLNEVVSFMPTAENLAEYIYEQIAYGLFLNGYAGVIKVVKIELWETPDCCATYWEDKTDD